MTKLESLLMNARSTLRQAVCPQCGRNGCVDTNLHCDWCVLRFDLNTEFLNFQSEPERPRVSALETERGHVPASIMWGDDEPEVPRRHAQWCNIGRVGEDGLWMACNCRVSENRNGDV